MSKPPLVYESRYSRTLARPPRRAALRVAMIYAGFGVAWILSSDFVVNTVFGQEMVGKYHIQTLKGWFFIFVTAALLYGLIRYTVTAVQSSERLRKQSEEHTRLLFERVRDYAIFMLDASGTVISWNRGAQQITDWREEDIVGKNLSVFYPPAEAQSGKPQRNMESAAGEGWHEEEAKRVRQDGSEFWASALLTALRDDRGQLVGYLAVIRDVTERRRVQDALRQSNETLRGLIAAAPLAMISLDRQDNVIGWNPAAEVLFGWSEQEVLGRPLPTVPPEELEQHRGLLHGQYEYRAATGVDVVRRRKDGAPLQLSLWTAPLLDADGQIAGAMGILVDLTDRKRAEEQVRQLNATLELRVKERTARLEEANEELQAFSYTVSHDLRIPLRSLQALARDLIEKHAAALEEEPMGDALRIVGGAARMERQIEDLLEYSRVSRSELKTEPLSLVLIVYELLGRLERDLKTREAEVAVREPLGWVLGHRLTLQQVILNLLTNAITFVAPGMRPAVNISATESGGIVRLCIEDNGIGIDSSDRQRVFDLFERLPAAEKYPGVGVGLAVVRRGVERMGGTITVESSPRGGSIFCIELPRSDPPGRTPA